MDKGHIQFNRKLLYLYQIGCVYFIALHDYSVIFDTSSTNAEQLTYTQTPDNTFPYKIIEKIYFIIFRSNRFYNNKWKWINENCKTPIHFARQELQTSCLAYALTSLWCSMTAFDDLSQLHFNVIGGHIEFWLVHENHFHWCMKTIPDITYTAWLTSTRY